MNTYAAYHVMWGGVDPSGMCRINHCRPIGSQRNKKAMGIVTTTAGANPGTIAAGMQAIGNAQTIAKFVAVTQPGRGLAAGAARGNAATGFANGTASGMARSTYGATTAPSTIAAVNNFMNSLQGSWGYGLFIEIEYEECVVCRWSCNPFTGFTKLTGMEKKTKYVKCTEGANVLDTYNAPNLQVGHPTAQNIADCIRRATR